MPTSRCPRLCRALVRQRGWCGKTWPFSRPPCLLPEHRRRSQTPGRGLLPPTHVQTTTYLCALASAPARKHPLPQRLQPPPGSPPEEDGQGVLGSDMTRGAGSTRLGSLTLHRGWRLQAGSGRLPCWFLTLRRGQRGQFLRKEMNPLEEIAPRGPPRRTTRRSTAASPPPAPPPEEPWVPWPAPQGRPGKAHSL